MQIAPAFSSCSTMVADFFAVYEKDGHAAVVGSPSTSILSLTENGIP